MSITPASRTIDDQILVNATLGDAPAFCRVIEAFGTVGPTISFTFDANGITITTTIDSKKKKNNPIYFEAQFNRWNIHSYIYASNAPKSIYLKFDKNGIVDRVKPIKQKEKFGFKVRKNVQAMFTLINDKGDDRLPAIIESNGESSLILPATISKTDVPQGWYSRADYADLCTAIRRASPCEVKMEVYTSALVFIVFRYGTKEGVPYTAGNITGEKSGVYNIDPTVFTLISTKVGKIVEELATIKFYVLPKAKDTTSTIFVTEMPAGVSGVVRIYYTADLVVEIPTKTT